MHDAPRLSAMTGNSESGVKVPGRFVSSPLDAISTSNVDDPSACNHLQYHDMWVPRPGIPSHRRMGAHSERRAFPIFDCPRVS